MSKPLETIVFDFPPEYDLLLQTMQYNNCNSTTLPGNINWPLLINLSESHGVMPLLYHYLHNHHSDNTPEEALTDLEHRYKANELKNRLLVQELIKIMQCFEIQGIQALAYKGPSLTISVYEDLSLRQFGDLDILINKNDVPDACKYLLKMGYQRTIPPLSPTKEKDFIRTDHEHEFISLDQLVNIDLHWALSTRRFPFHMESEQLFGRAETLSLPRGNLDHIATQDLLLLLCMHSNKDLWRKLVWACDIDRLIRHYKNINWDSLIEQAINNHCERMLYTSLLVTHLLLKTPVPELVLQTAKSKGFINQAQHAIQLCLKEEKTNKNYLQCLAIEPYILSLCDTQSDRFKYVIRTLLIPTETDMMRLNLPRYLHIIYYLITPARKILHCTAKYIKRKLVR